MLSTLLKKAKHYYNQLFQSQKNTWKGIKFIITIKNQPSDIPESLSSNGSTIISNVYNVYNQMFTVKPVLMATSM